jgi:hypothetical protein
MYYLYWIYVWTICLSGFAQKMAVPPRKSVSLASPRKWVAPLGAPPDPNGPRPDGRHFLSGARPKRTDTDVLAVRNGSARWRCPKPTEIIVVIVFVQSFVIPTIIKSRKVLHLHLRHIVDPNLLTRASLPNKWTRLRPSERDWLWIVKNIISILNNKMSRYFNMDYIQTEHTRMDICSSNYMEATFGTSQNLKSNIKKEKILGYRQTYNVYVCKSLEWNVFRAQEIWQI